MTLGEHAAHPGVDSESSFSAMREGEYSIRRLKMEAQFLADNPHDPWGACGVPVRHFGDAWQINFVVIGFGPAEM